MLFLLPVTALVENPLAASADFGTLIDLLKNHAIMGGLMVERRCLHRHGQRFNGESDRRECR